MPSEQDIPSFRGEGWNACSTFIHNVRTQGLKQGKLRDPAWMADYATAFMEGDALVFLNELPQDYQEDWTKLQKALIEWYQTSKDKDEPKPETKPSEINHVDRGILKVVVPGVDAPLYVQVTRNSTNSWCNIQNAADTALRFRFDSQSPLKLLECKNDRPYSWLAMHWNVTNPNVSPGSEHYAWLTTVASDTLKSSWASENAFQVVLCKISSSDEVTFYWRNGNTETCMTAFTGPTPATLCFTPDPKAYLLKWPNEKRLKLFMQKVN